MRQAMITTTILAAALAGCVHEMDLPEHFVAADRGDLGDYHVRGISADGVVVGMRSEKSAKGGTLEFWSRALANELTEGRGYKLAESEGVTSNSGLPGRVMTFSTTRSGNPFTYLLGVYVKADTVLIAEAGGKADAVKTHEEAMKKCFLSVR